MKAADLFTTATEKLTGEIDFRHVYLNFTDIEVAIDGNNVVRTCPAALGPGFAAGTTDGPGAFGFQQGDTEVSTMESEMNPCLSFFDLSLNFVLEILLQINKLWKQLRDSLKKPSEFQVGCQKPKTVLLDTGEMFEPYAWAVRKK